VGGGCRKFAEDSKMSGYLKNNGLLFFKKRKEKEDGNSEAEETIR
jgi:hypothetical protein